MVRVFFINAAESPIDFNRDIDFKSEDVLKSLEFGIRVELLYSKGADIIGIRVFFRVKQKDVQVLSYKVTLTYRIEGWNELIKGKEPDDYPQISEIQSIVCSSLGFFRGSMFVREQSTIIEGLHFPYIPTEEILEHIVVIEAAPERK